MQNAKPHFTFYFADEPQFATSSARYVTAYLLRSYRRHPERYELRRLGLHHYSVRCIGADATAILIA